MMGVIITSMSASLNPPLLALAMGVRTEQTITMSSGDFLDAAVMIVNKLRVINHAHKPAVGAATREDDEEGAAM